MSVPARAHERVLFGNLSADPCWFNCTLSCLLFPEHLSQAAAGRLRRSSRLLWHCAGRGQGLAPMEWGGSGA